MKSFRPNKKFKIGLVMAGAVTAGAYTAGVLDYLLNTLDLWYKEYQKNPKLVPKPNVVIETITGASAGSIAAAGMILALATRRFDNVALPIKEENKPQKNLLYDIWVEFGLKEGEEIMDKLFSLEDLEPKNESPTANSQEKPRLASLLNTSFIEDLVKKLCKDIPNEEVQKLPEFISEDLRILMTLSNLRGIPIDMSFSSEDISAGHSMSYHKAFALFKYGKIAPENPETDPDPENLPLNLTSKKDLELFLNCARASGAFPVGLKSVPFIDIPRSYIEANLKQIFKSQENISPALENIFSSGKNEYKFWAVDGGMTNNEPMAEAMRLLQSSRNQKEDDKKDKDDALPIILIDPFPSEYGHKIEKQDSESPTEYDITDNSLFNIIPQTINTLINQSVFKEQDLADLFDESSEKSMIWPTRSNGESGDEKVKYHNAIASGALGGFTGFLSKDFRKHDYALGQKNCQNFIRRHFSVEESKVKKYWDPSVIEMFRIPAQDGKPNRVPIIPDFRIEEFGGEHKLLEITEADFSPEGEAASFPQIDFQKVVLGKLKPLIQERLKAVTWAILAEKTFKAESHPFEEQIEDSFTLTRIRKKINNSWAGMAISAIGKLLQFLLYPPLKWIFKKPSKWLFENWVVSKTLPMILDRIASDLHKHDLIKDNPNPPDTRIIKKKESDKG